MAGDGRGRGIDLSDHAVETGINTVVHGTAGMRF